MRDQIFIDGEELDLNAGFKGVQLVFQSPYLTELKSITGNRTTTITLPATGRNLRLLGHSGSQAVSLFPYRYHRAVYLHDGVQMFSGRATLLSVGQDTVSVVLTWGSVESFTALFDMGLRELAGDAEQYIRLGSVTASENRYYSRVVDYGIIPRQPVPVLPVPDILRRIEQVTGVSGLSNIAPWKRLGVQLMTLRGTPYTRDLQAMRLGGITVVRGVYDIRDYSVRIGPGIDGQDTASAWDEATGTIYTGGAEQVRILLSGSIIFEVRYQNTNDPVFTPGLYLTRYDSPDALTPDEAVKIGTVTLVDSGPVPTTPLYYRRYQLIAAIDTTVPVGGSPYVGLELLRLNQPGYTAAVSVLVLGQSFSMGQITFDPGTDEEVRYATGLQAYPLWYNLPDLTVGQFIKNLMLMYGLFAYTDGGTALRFTSFDSLYAARSRARDWTWRVNLHRDRAKEKTFAIDGYARKNWLRYKEDDDIPAGQYDGFMACNNDTLEGEATLFESDFTLPRANSIPMWTDEDGELRFQGDGLTPRLLYDLSGAAEAVTAEHMGFSEELTWPVLIRKNYTRYARLIERPVVIKVQVILDMAELTRLDLTVPVYLHQTGRYYAIRKLTVQGGIEGEAELIEL